MSPVGDTPPEILLSEETTAAVPTTTVNDLDLDCLHIDEDFDFEDSPKSKEPTEEEEHQLLYGDIEFKVTPAETSATVSADYIQTHETQILEALDLAARDAAPEQTVQRRPPVKLRRSRDHSNASTQAEPRLTGSSTGTQPIQLQESPSWETSLEAEEKKKAGYKIPRRKTLVELNASQFRNSAAKYTLGTKQSASQNSQRTAKQAGKRVNPYSIPPPRESRSPNTKQQQAPAKIPNASTIAPPLNKPKRSRSKSVPGSAPRQEPKRAKSAILLDTPPSSIHPPRPALRRQCESRRRKSVSFADNQRQAICSTNTDAATPEARIQRPPILERLGVWPGQFHPYARNRKQQT